MVGQANLEALREDDIDYIIAERLRRKASHEAIACAGRYERCSTWARASARPYDARDLSYVLDRTGSSDVEAEALVRAPASRGYMSTSLR